LVTIGSQYPTIYAKKMATGAQKAQKGTQRGPKEPNKVRSLGGRKTINSRPPMEQTKSGGKGPPDEPNGDRNALLAR